MDAQTRAQVLRRLNYAGGHLEGIKKMTQDDRYCIDILKQSHAVRKALEKVEAIILEGHLHTCVVEGIQSGNALEVVSELVDIYEQAGR